ncbi:ArnT family glycosyltransferase [Rubripirellula obstinata]|uniref:ArnT family glycosyltransferase n=1 Tax=Rubripirellula obstinata TaxID=406547 RepID=UPI00122D2327|nr:hypothetical protein [Rubripirellula obstinata]
MKLQTAMRSSVTSVLKPLSRFSGHRLGIAVFLVAVVFRGAVGWVFVDNFDADPDAYAAIANSIERTGVYGLTDDQGIARPTAFRPPLYPWILAVLSISDQDHRIEILVLHAMLGGWTVLATFLIAMRYTSSRWSFLAAGLVLLDPILLMQSTLVMTETLATALAATVLWWCSVMTSHSRRPERAQRSSGNPMLLRCNCRNFAALVPAYSVPAYSVLGILLALSYLCRPTFLVWAVLLLFALAGVSAWRQRWVNMLQPAIALLIVAAGVGAWTARNWTVIGHPVWATTHGGYTLLLGNNPMFYQHLRTSRPGEAWDAEPFLEDYKNRLQEHPEIVDEHSDDRWAYEKAKATIVSQPQVFAYSSLVRLARLWSPMPHQVQGRSASMNLAVGIFYTCVFLTSLIGLFKQRHRLLEPFMLAGLTLAITLSVVHSVYWSNMRMRAPLTPALAVLVAAGCCRNVKVNTD